MQLLANDAELVVVLKPAGLRSTRERGDDKACVEALIEEQLGRRLWAVHQLDRDTSGVMLLVKRANLVAPWQSKLRGGSKLYLALTHGAVTFKRQTVELALKKNRDTGAVTVDATGKDATTRFDLLEASQDASAVLCRPVTGRTHQIRVHLAHLGHPLLGEARYRRPPSRATSRHMLHLWRVRAGGREWVADLPPDVSAALDQFGLRAPTSPPR